MCLHHWNPPAECGHVQASEGSNRLSETLEGRQLFPSAFDHKSDWFCCLLGHIDVNRHGVKNKERKKERGQFGFVQVYLICLSNLTSVWTRSHHMVSLWLCSHVTTHLRTRFLTGKQLKTKTTARSCLIAHSNKTTTTTILISIWQTHCCIPSKKKKESAFPLSLSKRGIILTCPLVTPHWKPWGWNSL